MARGPAVSVVLPIYNAQPYLRACLESVCGQTLQDIEVICVDDGSTDDSPDTLKTFAAADERVRVFSKPNGGYGHAMNYGLDRARGEFVAIVEPDDFIDPHMYEDLLSFAGFGGTPADIVKGSYWEFFDGRNGYADALHPPQLMNGMPKEPCAFGSDGVSDLLQFHPSIWSALYRREFLQENGIRFKEIPGAGWADNPFVFETMLAAQRVVWVPKAYYCYRLTNLNASTYVKDFHMPFDRMRDIREILNRRSASAEVRGAFYRREFNYISSIIGEYGFAERDPEVMELIREALCDMDSEIVHTSPYLLPSNVRYYEDFLSHSRMDVDEGSVAPAEGGHVQLSIIAPLRNDSRYAVEALDALASLQVDSFEVICVDCGTRDRTPLICRQRAAFDGRFRVLPGCTTSVPDGINKALDAARGRYAFVVDLSCAPLDGKLPQVLDHAVRNQMDLVMIDERSRFVVDAMRASGSFEGENRAGLFLSRPFGPQQAAGFLFDCCAPDRYAALCRIETLRQNGIRFRECESIGASGFCGRTAMASARIGYAAGAFYRNLDDTIYPPLGPHELRKELVVERPYALPAALDLAKSLPRDSPYAKSARSLVVTALSFDLAQRKTLETIRSYAEEFLPQANRIVGDHVSGLECHDAGCNVYVQLAQTEGLEGYLGFRCFEAENAMQWLGKDLRELHGSATMRAGRMVKRVADAVVPKKAIDKVRAKLH